MELVELAVAGVAGAGAALTALRFVGRSKTKQDKTEKRTDRPATTTPSPANFEKKGGKPWPSSKPPAQREVVVPQKHECAPPDSGRNPSAWMVGMLWRCDCGRIWRLADVRSSLWGLR